MDIIQTNTNNDIISPAINADSKIWIYDRYNKWLCLEEKITQEDLKPEQTAVELQAPVEAPVEAPIEAPVESPVEEPVENTQESAIPLLNDVAPTTTVENPEDPVVQE
jgi:hypothetical protein